MKKTSYMFLGGLIATMLASSLDVNATSPNFGESGLAYIMSDIELSADMLSQSRRNKDASNMAETESPIFEAPDGKYVQCYVDFSMAYFQSPGGGGLWGMPLCGKPTHYIVTDNDEVYLYNPVFIGPFSGDDTQLGSYIKGKLSDNTVTFKFPQPMGELDIFGNGEIIEMSYTNKMVSSIDEEGNNIMLPADEENNYLTYTIDEEGNLKMDGMDDGVDSLGLSTAEGVWAGYSTWQWNAKAFDPVPLAPPADMEITRWVFKDDMAGSVFVNIGIDGNDIWVQGLSRTYLPEAWAKGTIEGNTVVFPRCEYIGEATSVGQYAWLAGTLFDEDIEYDEEGLPIQSVNTLFDLSFDANEDFTELTAKKRVVINPNTIMYYALESYTHAVMTRLPDDFEPMPQQPVITSFNVYDDGSSDLWFRFNKTTSDGIPLEGSELFYEIYTPDGKLYTFTPEVYPSLEEEMSLIPRSTTLGGVFLSQGSNINVKLNILGIDNIGVQTVYISNGERYASGVVYYDTTGISQITSQNVLTNEYFTLTGRRVLNPEKGCFLKVTTFSDGSRKTEKVII